MFKERGFLGILSLFVVCASFGADTPLKLEKVVTNLAQPVFVCAAPADPNRIFILEQHTGRIRIFDLNKNSLQPTAFLTISGLTSGNEQGLLGLAFDPGYATNGFFFVNFTTSGGGAAGHTEIARYKANGDPLTASTADPASKLLVLRYDQPEVNHNGGWIGFGPDGNLYIAAGDGGGANDQHGSIGNGQNRSVLLGKILRLDVDHGEPYTIPADNPFKGDSTFKEEIWAFGLRNPWRCSFDPATGNLWIGDVGQDTREEVDVLPPGQGGMNFGWRPREGTIHTPAISASEVPVTTATNPLFDYSHTTGVCIIGGYVYRGSKIPGFQGYYIVADYGSGRFWTMQYDGNAVFNVRERTSEINPAATRPIRALTSFGVDASGEIYLCDHTDGEIWRLVSALPPLKIASSFLEGDQFKFTFDAAAGTGYVVEALGAFDTNSTWEIFQDLPATNVATTLTIQSPITNSARYFRVRQK